MSKTLKGREYNMNTYSLFDSLFDDMMGGTPTIYAANSRTPRVDVTADEKAYYLDMELPGFCEENVNIELDNKALTISSKECKEAKKEKNEKKVYIKERRCMSFSRTFTLPDDIDAENITAAFKNGILTLTMPKIELPKPKKILINAA